MANADSADSSPNAEGLSQDERSYAELIVLGSAQLTRAQTLADRFAAARSEGKSGRTYLRAAGRLMATLNATWLGASAPTAPSARLAKLESRWHQALFNRSESLDHLTSAMDGGSWKQVTTAQKRGMSYRRKGFHALARVVATVRSLSGGAQVPGLSADLGVDPYSWGTDENVAYRKDLWREYRASVEVSRPNMKRIDEIRSRFDAVLMGRAAEWRITNDWYGAPFMAPQ